jgi:hypothetical protein
MRCVTLLVEELCGQGVELFSRGKALGPVLNHQWPLLEHVHEFDTDERALGRIKRLEPEQRPRHPLYCSVILLDDIVEVFPLANHDGGAVFLVVAADSRRIGLTAVDGDLGGYAVPAAGLGQKALGRLLVPRLGQQKVKRLAGVLRIYWISAPLVGQLTSKHTEHRQHSAGRWSSDERQ